MVYRSLYFSTSAYQRGKAIDPVAYLAANADCLRIIKRKRKGARVSRFRNLVLTYAAGP
jgi:hypothetical protein